MLKEGAITELIQSKGHLEMISFTFKMFVFRRFCISKMNKYSEVEPRSVSFLVKRIRNSLSYFVVFYLSMAQTKFK